MPNVFFLDQAPFYESKKIGALLKFFSYLSLHFLFLGLFVKSGNKEVNKRERERAQPCHMGLLRPIWPRPPAPAHLQLTLGARDPSPDPLSLRRQRASARPRFSSRSRSSPSPSRSLATLLDAHRPPALLPSRRLRSASLSPDPLLLVPFRRQPRTHTCNHSLSIPMASPFFARSRSSARLPAPDPAPLEKLSSSVAPTPSPAAAPCIAGAPRQDLPCLVMSRARRTTRITSSRARSRRRTNGASHDPSLPAAASSTDLGLQPSHIASTSSGRGTLLRRSNHACALCCMHPHGAPPPPVSPAAVCRNRGRRTAILHRPSPSTSPPASCKLLPLPRVPLSSSTCWLRIRSSALTRRCHGLASIWPCCVHGATVPWPRPRPRERQVLPRRPNDYRSKRQVPLQQVYLYFGFTKYPFGCA